MHDYIDYIDYTENKNIKEEHLGSKKMLLKKIGNAVFANHLLEYLRIAFWDIDFLNIFFGVIRWTQI